MSVLCFIGTAALVVHSLRSRSRRGGGRVVIVDPIRQADEARAEGTRLLKARRFDEAIERYGDALARYEKLREDHPGPGYEYLEEEMTITNVLLRTARQYATFGPPPELSRDDLQTNPRPERVPR